jgi:hypothetical protein
MHPAAPRATARWVGPAVLLLHALALLFAWRAAVAPSAGLKNATAMLLQATEPVAEQRPPPPRPSAAAPARERRPTATVAPRITPPAPARLPAETAAAIRPDDAASEPLLDSAATRNAIRASVRQPGLAARARDEQGADPLSTSARLGNNIEQAAHGDCGKGEYVGGGMGLLSLPFWAAAELRGKCAR